MTHKLQVVPVALREANAFVDAYHRHNAPTRGCKFCLGANFGDMLAGVAIIGRPVARLLQDGLTAEVLRCCVQPDAPKNTPSFLYGRAWRVWQAMGGRRMVTYTLDSESGASLRAVNWRILGTKEPIPKGKGWTNRGGGRMWHPAQGELRLRWEIASDLIPDPRSPIPGGAQRCPTA